MTAIKRGSLRRAMPALLLAAVFLGVNLLFLTRYPFVHSDESWLTGLTRNMMERGSISVTEPFFDLVERHPHAIKLLFHLLQMPFISLFGYGAFSVRLLSLLSGTAGLLLFWRAASLMEPDSQWLPLGAALVLAVDPQFIAASHLARQEILLCGVLLLCLPILLKPRELSRRDAVLLGLISGLSAGLHPNGLLAAALCGCGLLVRALLYREVSLRRLLLYAGVTGAAAGLFVAISLWMNPHFFSDYFGWGAREFGLDEPVSGKLAELPYFFSKLWHRVSGTYFVPELRPQLLAFPFLLGLSLLYALMMRREDPARSRRLLVLLSGILGVLLGTVVIGRYNQTGMVFFTVLCWLTLPTACRIFGKWAGGLVYTGLLAAVAVAAVISVSPWLSVSYENYLDKLEALVPADEKTVANLNAGFYFENDSLLDYRNLALLSESGLSVEEYVRQNGVKWLVISDELELIYSTRPKWNMIYGNPMFVEELRAFLAARCERVGSFTDNAFGVRIIEEQRGERAFTVTVWRVVE